MIKTGMNLLLWTTHVTEEHDASSSRSRRWASTRSRCPIFDTADLAPFERLGKRIKALGLARRRSR